LSKGESYEQLDSTMQGGRSKVIIERPRRVSERERRVVRSCKKETQRHRRMQKWERKEGVEKKGKRFKPFCIIFLFLTECLCEREETMDGIGSMLVNVNVVRVFLQSFSVFSFAHTLYFLFLTNPLI
jgi:hypothetical protein